jgi:hypothetical protein
MPLDEAPPGRGSSDESTPRVFSRAAGVVLQFVGVTIALSSCCLWSFAGLMQRRLSGLAGEDSLVNIFRTAGPGPILAMVGTCLSFAGGLALATFGLGLQAERRRSGTAAVVVTALNTVFWLMFLAWALLASGGVGRVILGVVMTLIWGMCLLLSIVSADELRRFPPPPGLDVAPPDLKIDRVVDREMPSDLR